MKPPRSFSLGLVALALIAPTARAQGRIPEFALGVAVPDESGRNGLFWLGGDSPFGIPLGPDVSFWAFGDTYLSTPGTNGRKLSSVVSNTVAVARVVDGKFTPSYYYRGSIAEKRAFFPDPDPAHKYWPKASAMLGGRLYVFLSAMYVAPGFTLGDPAGCLETASVVARVANPLDPPTRWRIDYLDVHREGPKALARLKLGIEVLPSPSLDALVVYGFFNDAPTDVNKSIVTLISGRALRETPAGGTIDPAGVQHLAAGPANDRPRWEPGFGDDRAVDDYLDTRIDSVSGFSARWNATLRRWQVVGANSQYAAAHPYPKGHPYVPRPCARIFMHPSPFGPFVGSPEAADCHFFTFPELKAPDPSLFCYSARQWQDPRDPAFATDARLLITYTYSSRDMITQVFDPTMYQNHHALVANPFSGPAPGPPACASRPSPWPDAPPPGVDPADPFATPGVPRPLPFPAR